MKLYNETSSITEMWEEDKENNKAEIKKTSSIKRSKSRIAVMYENTFYNHPRLDSVRKNILGTLKGKRKITPSSLDTSINQPSPQQPCSSENTDESNTDPAVVNTCTGMEATDKIDLSSTVEYPDKVKAEAIPTVRKCPQRQRRHTEYGIGVLNCRTEFTIPGEFLFCSHVEHNNNFATLYRRISSGSDIRRSKSAGNIRLPETTKTNIDLNSTFPQTKVSTEDAKSEHRATRSSSCITRNTCEKYPKKSSGNIERKTSKRRSKSSELQSVIDNKNEGLKRNTCQGIPETETSFTLNSDCSKIEENSLFSVRKHVPSSARNPSNRRSQSCKTAQKRQGHLFNISRYLKDRNTQRSKSFATIREFSTHDTRKTKSMYVDARKSYGKISSVSDGPCDTTDGKSNTDVQHNTYGQHIAEYEQSEDIELTPIKTTRSFDINHTDARGNSCLHHASSKGDISTIKYLLSQGGDVWVTNDDHRLPIDLAQNFQTAKLLSCATLFYSEQNEARNERNIIQTSKLNIAL